MTQTTQAEAIAKLKAQATTIGSSVTVDCQNPDGSHTLHVAPPDGRGTMGILIRADGTASSGWVVSPAEFDKGYRA